MTSLKKSLLRSSLLLLPIAGLAALIVAGSLSLLQSQPESRTRASIFKKTTTGFSEKATDTSAREDRTRDYLEHDIGGRSLMQALTAARFGLAWQPHAPSGDAGAGFLGVSPEQSLSTWFGAKGITVSPEVAAGPARWRMNMQLTAYGHGVDLMKAPAIVSQSVKGNRIEYSRAVAKPESAITEWYENSAKGVEQGFTVNEGPSQKASPNEPMRLVLSISGGLVARLTDGGRKIDLLDERGKRALNYGELSAVDAAGRTLPTRLETSDRGRKIVLSVDDAGASFPVTIDPLLWQQQAQLTGGGGQAFDYFGWSVAISGNTAIVGAREDYFRGVHQGGSAYIFVRSRGAWTQQQKLVGGQNTTSHRFGEAVAIEGDTAVVGAVGEQINGLTSGSVHVYVRSGGRWSEEQNLFPPDGQNGDFFGRSVAISNNTIIVGTNFGRGAYVFTRTNAGWVQQAKLTNSDAQSGDLFGFSVGISGDSAIVGALGDKRDADGYPKGSISIFTRSNGAWTPQQKLEGVAFGDRFGISVGISGDTAIAGSENLKNPNYTTPENLLRQFVTVFARSNGEWSIQQVLVASGNGASSPGDGFGSRAAISSDNIVVGAPGEDASPNNGERDYDGAAYVFTRSNGAWAQPQRMVSRDSTPFSGFGNAVGISGGTAVVGAYSDDIGTSVNRGAAYVFLNTPDTDGDGLPDDWEINGVNIDGVFIDLPKMGANPLHKDIFVHVEWMQPDPARPAVSFKPNSRAIKMVSDAFLRAPVDNPDHKSGIRLHVDVGPDSIMNPVNGAKWGSLSRTGAGDLPYQAVVGSLDANGDYVWSGVDTIKQMHFGPAKRAAVFHYALFANDYAGANTSSGLSRDLPGTDFMVTLGLWDPAAGTIMQQAGTFMHELGHNLGLHHGGNDELNHKPNYLSVMNYTFQEGLLNPNGRQRSFDYSRSKLPDLNENNLNESAGISDPAGHLTLWSVRTRQNSPLGTNKCIAHDNFYRLFYPGSALDWDCDGTRNAAPITTGLDLNGDGVCISPGPNQIIDSNVSGDDDIRLRRIVSGPNRKCESVASGDDVQEQSVNFVEPNVLPGFKDWSVIVFDGDGSIGNFAGAGFAHSSSLRNEPTMEQILDFLPSTLINEELLAPLDVATATPQTGGAPLQVSFDGSASTTVSGTIVSWDWDFGDDTSGTGAIVNHTYNAPGDYYASLTVTDSNGHVNLVPLVMLITVTNDPPPTPTPTPTATPTPTPIPTPTPVPTATPTPQLGDTDPSFNTSVTRYGGHTLNAVVAQPDGKTIIGGEFESFAGCVRRDIARINPDGSCDATFDPGLLLTEVYDQTQTDQHKARRNLLVQALALQPDGKILVGLKGERGLTNGVSRASRGIYRLNPDGSVDSTFDTSTDFVNSYLGDDGITTVLPNVDVRVIAIQPDGKILIGGSFTYLNGSRRSDFARLNADGSLDTSFMGGLGYLRPTRDFQHDNHQALAIQPDGKIFVGGLFFSNGPYPGVPILRVNADGSLDRTFNRTDPTSEVPLTTFGLFSVASALALQPDGKLIMVGGIREADGQTPLPIVRLNPNGSRDSLASVNGFLSGLVTNVALQSDGRMILAGNFEIGGNPATSADVVRLNTDGTRDSTYLVGSGTLDPLRQSGGGLVNALTLKTNGQAFVVGEFSHFNDLPSESIAQLNADGSRDQSYDSNGPGFHDEVLALVRQPDGKLLVGFFNSLVASDDRNGDRARAKVNSTRIGEIGRVNADGTTDTSFTSPYDAGSAVQYITLQPDGKIVVGGSLKLIGDTSGTQVFLDRLNSDGTRDTSFHPASGAFGPAALQPDAKMIVSQALDSRSTQLIRLNPNGSLDNTFSVFLPNGSASVAAFLADGRMIITGFFHLPDGRDARIARLNPNGTYDTSLDPGAGPDGTVRAFVMQPDGKILIGGNFMNYNGTPRSSIARVNTDGSLDSSFVPINPNTFQNGQQFLPKPVGALALQPDGKILAGGYYQSDFFQATPNRVFRLNADGSLDSSFPLSTTGLEATPGNVNVILLQSDGQALVGGGFNVVNGVARLGLARVIAAVATAPTPTPTPTPAPTVTPTPTPTPTPIIPGVSNVQFAQSTYSVTEGTGDALITISRTGDLSGSSSVDFATIDDPANVNCDDTVNNHGAAYARCDYATTVATLTFAPGETLKVVSVPIVADTYTEGSESFQLRLANVAGSILSSPAVADVVIVDDVEPGVLNPLLRIDFFVRQHYLDFLSREPDMNGLNFWIGTLNGCDSIQGCFDVKRINTSAAFFLSIEFQETGYLVERSYKVAYGDSTGTSTLDGTHQLTVPIIRFDQFLVDVHQISQGVVVNQGEWQQQLENNKRAYLADFVQRPRFIGAFPPAMTPTQFVDTLNSNAGGPLSPTERNQLIADLTSGAKNRAQIVRAVAEDPDLHTAEFNRAFVLMQYFGYLRRNPNDGQDADYSGYDFWLRKMNQFNGNFVDAEMVKSFINSTEYRRRFGP